MGTAYRKPNSHNRILESSRVLKVDGTDYKLAIPYSLQPYGGRQGINNRFTIGPVEFEVMGDRVVPLGKIPASWLVPLNA